jgi:restriction system protein
METTSRYSPELLGPLTEAVSRLFRGKKDVLLFFRAAGVGKELTADVTAQIEANPESISKLEVVRKVLRRLNEAGDRALGERQEVLKRVMEFRDFGTCWSEDQSKVKELLSEIRRVVNVKGAFVRMHEAVDEERSKHLAEQAAKLAEAQRRKSELSKYRDALARLFSENDNRKRDESLADVLNGLFATSGILVREAFALKDFEREGVEEQVGGVLEMDGYAYLVELIWPKDRVGHSDISEHLVRIQDRIGVRGIFISASGYSESALAAAREGLQHCVVVLLDLKDIVLLLEQGKELADFLRTKIRAAIANDNPYLPGV